MLNESQAWIKIAEAFYKEHEISPSYYFSFNRDTFICTTITDFCIAGLISGEMGGKMRTTTLGDVKLYSNSGVCFNLPIEESKSSWFLLRADYAILQAWIIESESE